MKNKLLIILFLLTTVFAYAQIEFVDKNAPDGILTEKDDVSEVPKMCLTPDEHKKIKTRIDKSVKNMIKAGLLEKHFGAERNMDHPLFQWPLRQADGFNDPGYYTISNYVDLDPTGGLLDYNGLDQTYDGHNGIDISSYPYWWKKMDDSQVEAIAPDDGIIIFKQDGNDDDHCSCFGSWNAIYLLHSDGSITWNGHFKTNTTTEKDSGDFVNAGEFLGVVGSSGCSTNPHLHFEVYNSDGDLIEPFFGPFNNTAATESWWEDQLPYYDSGINKIATHSTPPITPSCPNIESPNEKTSFNQGDPIAFTIAVRHSLTSDSAVMRVFEPDGDISNMLNLTFIRTGDYFLKRALFWWTNTINSNAETGKWTYQVTYYSTNYSPQTVSVDFWVKEDCQANIIHNSPLTEDAYYQTSNTITSLSSINNGTHIVYDSENVTTLLPGFIAPVGSKLEIKLARM